MKYLIPLILLVSGCATNSSSQKKMDNCSNLETMVGSCTNSIKDQLAGNQNGAILIGFLLHKMNNKERLSKNIDRILSISLKNVENGNSYNINLNNRNFGMKTVEPGVYCLSKVTTYVNFSINLCNKGTIPVNPGEIKNAGYWLAGINYDTDKVKLKVFDTNAKKIDLYEDATKYYGNFIEEELKVSPKVSASDSIVGYWYTTEETIKTYLFEADGNYYKSSELYDNGNLNLSGYWSWTKDTGEAELKNKYGYFKMTKQNEKLLAIYENIKGLGVRWLAYRNPIRLWDLNKEYDSPVVQYDRSTLEKVTAQTKKSVYIEINYNSSEPKHIARVGKKVFMRPNGQKVVRSNLSSTDEKKILDTFYKWRFATEAENQTLTICMINGEYPDECLSPGSESIIFESGKKYPIHGMGF